MTPEETHVLTHYTEIAEAKQRDVRQLQAASARNILQGVFAAIYRPFQRSQRRNEVQVSDRA